MSYWPDENKPHKGIENRRTGPDEITKFVRFSSFLSWLLLVLTGILADASTPSQFNIYVLDKKWGKTSGTIFRVNYIYASFAICVFTFLFILTSLVIDSRRQKRQTDHYSFSLLIALIADFMGLIAFVVYFMS